MLHSGVMLHGCSRQGLGEDAEESVVFQLDVKTGTKLAGLGVDGEAEVLLMPGVRLLVTNIDRREHSLVDAHSSLSRHSHALARVIHCVLLASGLALHVYVTRLTARSILLRPGETS